MRGLDSRIHAAVLSVRQFRMDRRVKPGGDERRGKARVADPSKPEASQRVGGVERRRNPNLMRGVGGFAALNPPYTAMSFSPRAGRRWRTATAASRMRGCVPLAQAAQLPLTRIARRQACAGCASLPAPRSDLSPQAGRGDLQQQSLLKLHARRSGFLRPVARRSLAGCRTFLPCPEGEFGSSMATCQRLAQAAQYRLIDKSEMRLIHMPRLAG